MNETEFRQQLFDLAEDAPSGSSAPPALLRRARRRVVVTIASSVAIAVLVVGMGIAGVRALQTAPTPADPPVPTPTPGSLGSLAYGVDGDIYVANWDGSNAVRIADGRPADDCGGLGEYWGEGSIWSPDGRYLAYRHTDCDASRDMWWDVVISDPEGNVVTSFPSEGWTISWSPDSTRVAVWECCFYEDAPTIGVYGLDGERQAVLTVPPGMMAGGDSNPEWLPDGESLMVQYGVEIPLDGSTPRKLPWADPKRLAELGVGPSPYAGPVPSEGGATYSPDGSRVAYNPMLGSSANANERLFVAAADGSHPREVSRDWTYRFGGGAVWSPTGDRIAFLSDSGLRVLDLATGTVTLLVETDGSDLLSVLAFSPEGDRILFSRTEDGGKGVSSLWSVNADGSDLRRLVTGTAWGDWLSPSPTH
jgi:Tol biopolymer transport system component